MAIPTYKAPEIEKLLKKISGVDRVSFILDNLCTNCGGDALSFENTLSSEEYRISGHCQTCQNQFDDLYDLFK